MPRIVLLGLIWLLAGIVGLIRFGSVALVVGQADFGLGSRLVQGLYVFAGAAAVPSIALLCVIERLARRAGVIESDTLDLVVTRLRRLRRSVDREWQEIPPVAVVSYSAYLESEAWRDRRRYKLDQVGFRCQVCNSPHRLEVHHRTYERVGHELPEDLTVLCRDCHRLVHRNRAG